MADILPQADTARRLVSILVSQWGVSEADIDPDVLLVPEHDDRGRKLPSDRKDLGADSLDVVELLMATEDEFKIELPDDQVEQVHEFTFGQLVDFIHSRLEPAHG